MKLAEDAQQKQHWDYKAFSDVRKGKENKNVGFFAFRDFLTV